MLSIAASREVEEIVSATPPVHRSVLLRECMELLRPVAGGTYVDATLGPGGHAEALLEATAPNGEVVGIDRDPETLAWARTRLGRHGDRFRTIHGDHRDLRALLERQGIFVVDGVLADLGISSLQLDDPQRGFSFSNDGPLDMRMDPHSGGPTAEDLLRTMTEAELRRILRVYGEEKLAAPIARAILRRRDSGGLRTTLELATLVARVAGPAARRFRIHPATRTFQALRIAVNGEIDGLQGFVTEAVSLLRRGGRLAVISFHSLEDRAIKHAMRGLAERCICPPGLPVCGCGREDLVRIVTPRPVLPGPEEIERNPRSRSAKLRAVERL